jgi:hypothetical protein
MRKLFQILLVLEFLLVFFPIFFLWLMSFFAFYNNIMAMFAGDFSGLLINSITFLGGLGLYGILQLVVKNFSSNFIMSKPDHIYFYLFCGFCALFGAAFIFPNSKSSDSMLILLPMIVTFHFIYLNRRHLVKGT